MSIAVITVVVIGTLPVNVDAKKVTKYDSYKKGGKTGGKTGAGTGGKAVTKAGAKCRFVTCYNTALYKCDFKRLLEDCPEMESFSLTPKRLTGTLPAALQSFTNLTTLCVKRECKISP